MLAELEDMVVKLAAAGSRSLRIKRTIIFSTSNEQKWLEKIATKGILIESVSLRCIFLEKQKFSLSFLTEL